MKHTILVEKEVDIKYVKIVFPLCCDDQNHEIPQELNDNGTFFAEVEIDTGSIVGFEGDFDTYYEACDRGDYHLYDSECNLIASIKQNYVPHGLIPGEYGDYVELKVKGGIITNWPKEPDLSEFFEQKEGDY
jgi:hypothetical protein